MRNVLVPVALATLLTAAPASAVPIAAGSTLSLLGTDLFTATSVSFTGPAGIGARNGDFITIGTCASCVTMSDFNAASASFTVYSATVGGVSTDLELDSVSFSQSAEVGGLVSLTVTGEGTATLTGFDPTPGSFTLTTQGPPGGATEVTFSSTTVTEAPEPASLALIGAALLGLGLVRRRRV